ncbi:DUF7693 family protein [Pseudomonas sp. X10]
MPLLTSREAYQCLRDAALGVSTLIIRGHHPDGVIEVEIDGWRLALHLDNEGLAHCAHCRSPDGRSADLANWQRYGTNPVQLLSSWELQQVEQLLRDAAVAVSR